MSIPDLAVEIVNKTLKDANEDTARTIVLVGSKSAVSIELYTNN